MSRKRPLTPRNGSTFQVLIVARISGCTGQKDVSLEDQSDHAKAEIAEHYSGPVEYHTISTKGKGERVDRPELDEIKAQLRTKRFDVLICEDLGRIVRGTEAKNLCGIAVDNETRVLAINDCIDTDDEHWEEDVIAACRDHVGHNSHTSKRIKQKLMNRFIKEGRSIARETYGYLVPDDAKRYDEWQRDETATPIFQEWFRQLLEGASLSLVADWLNERNVRRGPYCRKEKWDCQAVSSLTRNPILKGTVGRGYRKTVKHHESGRRISERNPDGPTFREFPHLAHVEPDVWEEVNRLLTIRNAPFRRVKTPGAIDCRKGVPFKRTVWPGQHSVCGVCGRRMYWGGHGQRGHLVCSGTKKYLCWNAATCDGALVVRKILEALHREIAALPDFDPVFRERLRRAAVERTSDKANRLRELDHTIVELDGKVDRLVDAVAATGTSTALAERLAHCEAERTSLVAERTRLRAEPDDVPDLPPHEEVLRMAREQCTLIDPASPEAGRFLSALCPVVEFRPYVQFGSERRVLRAFVTMNFARLIAPGHVAGLGDVFVRHVVVDGFIPPIPVRFHEGVMRRKSDGSILRAIAKAEKISFGSVQHTINLHNKLTLAGLIDPYEAITAPPNKKKGRHSRHNHTRFQFTTLPGYPWWTREQAS